MSSSFFIEKQKDILSKEVESYIENIGKEIKKDILENFDKSVFKETEELKSLIKESALSYNKKFLKQSQKNLQNILKEQFKGSLVTEVFSDSVISSLFEGGSNLDNIKTNVFSNTTSQIISEFTKLLAKNAARNT